VAFPSEQLWGDVAAVARSDASHARQFFATGGNRGSVIGSPGSDLIWAGGKLLDAWPASPDENRYTRVQDSNVETLLIGGNLDVATPPQWATRELLPHLPKGQEVVLENLGHTNDFWTYEAAAGKRLINTFFASGRVDDSLYTRASVDFTPAFSHGAVAKIVLGVMLGLAAVTVLSLLWISLRVRRRGPYGRKAGLALRSLYPIVLGLGGWFLGVLIVLTAMPGVPLDDELLAILSVGVPIGLGIYWASLRRDWSGATRTAGFVAASAGSLAGAWFGFHATSGLLAVVTTIVGATAAANLLLVVLGMTREHAVRRGVTADAPPQGSSIVAA
jgi:TAP-like protein